MVISCSAINCKNRQNCGNVKLQFHKFPLKNEILCLKWMLAVRRDNWRPTRFSFICGEHFTDDDYKSKCRRYLKPFAVPSIFNFEQGQKKNKGKIETILQHPTKETTRNLDAGDVNVFSQPQSTSSTSTSDLGKFCNKGIQTERTGWLNIHLLYQNKEIQTNNSECPIKIKKLRRTAKIIQMKLLRRKKKISNLEDILGYLTNTCEIPESEMAKLNEMFGNILSEIQLSWGQIK